MHFAVVYPAQWNGELIARLAAHGPWLRVTKVVGFAWLPATNHASLSCYKAQVLLVTITARSFGLRLVYL